jgi:hypothetical protein
MSWYGLINKVTISGYRIRTHALKPEEGIYAKFFVPYIIIQAIKNKKRGTNIIIYKPENYTNYNNHHIIQNNVLRGEYEEHRGWSAIKLQGDPPTNKGSGVPRRLYELKRKNSWYFNWICVYSRDFTLCLRVEIHCWVGRRYAALWHFTSAIFV